MKSKSAAILVLIAAIIVAGYGALSYAEDGAEELFESTCSACHDTDRPKSEQKSAEDWKTTVNMMRDTYGADISDGDAEKIVDYLSEHYGE